MWRFVPSSILPHEPLESLLGGGGPVSLPSKKSARLDTSIDVDAATLTVNAAIAMIAAILLILPVAWVYILTRHKKGYQQSVVQTLVILPPVVAGVVTMVK